MRKHEIRRASGGSSLLPWPCQERVVLSSRVRLYHPGCRCRIRRKGERKMAEDKFMLPDSPAGRQLRWYLGVLCSHGEAASAADHERYAPKLVKRMGRADTDEQARRNFRSGAERLG